MVKSVKLWVGLILAGSWGGAASAWATPSDDVRLTIPGWGQLVLEVTKQGEGQVMLSRSNGEPKGYRTETKNASGVIPATGVMQEGLGRLATDNWVKVGRRTWWTRLFPSLVVAIPQHFTDSHERRVEGPLARIGGMALKLSAHGAVGLKRRLHRWRQLIPRGGRTAKAKGNLRE